MQRLTPCIQKALVLGDQGKEAEYLFLCLWWGCRTLVRLKPWHRLPFQQSPTLFYSVRSTSIQQQRASSSQRFQCSPLLFTGRENSPFVTSNNTALETLSAAQFNALLSKPKENLNKIAFFLLNLKKPTKIESKVLNENSGPNDVRQKFQ